MKATIKQSQANNDSRAGFGRNIIYIESPFDNAVDKFATENGVWNLDFKSKVWSSVCKQATKTNLKALKELFPDATSIKFSRKAGCSCGCSPGYIMRLEPNVRGRHFWVDVTANSEEVEEFKQIVDNKFVSKLQEEIALNSTKRQLSA